MIMWRREDDEDLGWRFRRLWIYNSDVVHGKELQQGLSLWK